jgi:hypothetical protein
MPVRSLSDAELARPSGWPEEMADEDAVTFFTLTGDDLAWLAGFTGTTTGWALRWAVHAAVAGLDPRRPDRLPVTSGVTARRCAGHRPRGSRRPAGGVWGWQGRTRRDHRAQVLARLGWRWCAAG